MKEVGIRARRRLDQRLSYLQPLDRFAVPPRGWIRAIRDALGMTGAHLGGRMGMTAQSVVGLEKSEATGRVQLNTLRKAAEAMDCVLVYALVPRKGLQEAVDARAREIATKALGRISHSMALEDQYVQDDQFEDRIQRYIATAIRDQDLWTEA